MSWIAWKWKINEYLGDKMSLYKKQKLQRWSTLFANGDEGHVAASGPEIKVGGQSATEKFSNGELYYSAFSLSVTS